MSGSISTVEVWKTSVRRNEIAAETAPLFSAVKKDDRKMFMPESRNANEKILNA